MVRFKLEEEIYLKLKNMARDEGRGISEILREALTDWLGKKKSASASDFIIFMREQKKHGKTWSEMSSLMSERYGVSLSKDQLSSLARPD